MGKTRNIFEEVTVEKSSVNQPKSGIINREQDNWRNSVSVWLKILFSMVVAMVIVGGLTRLTDSGLSITEWNVIKGALPPLNDAAWILEFDKYKTIVQISINKSAR